MASNSSVLDLAGHRRDAADQEAAAAARWWREEWARFPTLAWDESGSRRFWAVPADSGRLAEDWRRGEDLAERTVRQMQRFPEGSAVLRRILRDLDYNSNVGQGFLARIEDMLAQPALYLDPPAASRGRAER